MPVTHFIITSIPSSVIAKIGVDPVELNTLYAIALENTLSFERTPSLDGFYVSEVVKYKAYDDTLFKYGNEASMNIIWKEYDLSKLPLSLSTDALRLNSISEHLLSLLPINSATEFIEIVAFSGVNNLKSNGILVVPGQRLSPKEMLNTIYTTNLQGGGDPYFSLQYKTGKDNVASPEIYTTNIKVDSLAELMLFSQSSVQIIEEFDEMGTLNEYPVFRETILIDVIKGYQGGTAEIEITINAPFLTSTSIGTQSSVTVDVNGFEIQKIANEIFTVSLNLDENGKGQIKIVNEIIKDGASETGQIDFDLISINENPLLVSATNAITTTSNF